MANTAKIRKEIAIGFARGFPGRNLFGTPYFVDATNGNDSKTGREFDDAVKTIAKAISLGKAGDTIILSPEDHSVDVSVAALVPKANMQFFGAIPSYGGMPSSIISVDADDGNDLVTINVDGVQFKDIMFQHFLNASTAIRLFDIGQTAAVNGLAFIDCRFDMNSADVTGGTALNIDDATNKVTGMVIRNCAFVGGDATTATNLYIDIGVAGVQECLIEHSIFCCESTDDNYAAISFADPGGTGKNYGTVIRYNSFIGPIDGAVTLVPILTPAGDSGEYPMQWHSNFFSYCLLACIPIDQMDQALVRNYIGDLTAGGTIVDAGT